MRISCPYCGSRDVSEFSYLGDAAPQRPDSAGDASSVEAAFLDYVYLRDNPAGPHRGLWYHGGGCRSWLVVTRNPTTHEILEVAFVGTELQP